jgi:hypothetical protein
MMQQVIAWITSHRKLSLVGALLVVGTCGRVLGTGRNTPGNAADPPAASASTAATTAPSSKPGLGTERVDPLNEVEAKLVASMASMTGTEANLDKAERAAESALGTLKKVTASRPDKQPTAEDIAIKARIDEQLDAIESARVEQATARLAAREFITIAPDTLVNQITGPNGTELFETKYEKKYVRWKAKYVQPGTLKGFYANAGTMVEMSCDFDETQDSSRLQDLKDWQSITIEARFVRPAATAAMDPRRAKMVFDECIIR